MAENKEIQLTKRPEGVPTKEHLQVANASIPEVKEGEVLLRTLYVSVDPYMRGRMSNEKSYIPPFALNEAIEGGVIAQVERSRAEGLIEGDIVTGNFPFTVYTAADANQVRKVNPDAGPVTASLGALGMPGLTAYFGLLDIGKPQEGETVVVSGAAGAVGSIVVQIAKIKGATVIGIAGTDEKTTYLSEKLGADGTINYKKNDVSQELERLAPNGVDVYFDNVGGEIADTVFPMLNDFARVVQCGSISTYNTPNATGPRLQPYIVKSRALVKGFIVGDYRNHFREGLEQLGQWLQEDKLVYEETIK